MAEFGITDKEFKELVEETEKALGRQLTEEEKEQLRKANE